MTFFAYLRQQTLSLLIIIIGILGSGEKIAKKRGKDYIYVYANIKRKKKNSPRPKNGIYFYFQSLICHQITIIVT